MHTTPQFGRINLAASRGQNRPAPKITMVRAGNEGGTAGELGEATFLFNGGPADGRNTRRARNVASIMRLHSRQSGPAMGLRSRTAGPNRAG